VVGDRDVDSAVAVAVSRRHEVRREGNGHRRAGSRRESAPAVAEEDREVPPSAVRDEDVRASIAVDVGESDARRLPSGGKSRDLEPDARRGLSARRPRNGERAAEENCAGNRLFRG